MHQFTFCFLIFILIGCNSEAAETEHISEDKDTIIAGDSLVKTVSLDSVEAIKNLRDFTDSISNELEAIELDGDSIFDEFSDKFENLMKDLEQ